MTDLSFLTVEAILPFVAIGFAAQLVDGALGMAFGIISNSLLLVLGVPPAMASAGVHTVETFTTAASGVSHAIQHNVRWPLFLRLALPGMIGGALGAYVLANIDAGITRPLILAYLVAIGLYLLWRAIRHVPQDRNPRIVEPLGLIGGFLDAAGGGGWGPVVTSNLLAQGAHPRTTVGTVNTAEFFTTLVISLTFISQIGLAAFSRATIGLLIGGVVAAPLGALLARSVPARRLLLLVGSVLIATSLFNLWHALTR